MFGCSLTTLNVVFLGIVGLIELNFTNCSGIEYNLILIVNDRRRGLRAAMGISIHMFASLVTRLSGTQHFANWYRR